MSIRRMMLFTLGGFFKSIIALFKTRVLTDGGTFEAETNLENQLNTLGSDLFDSASLVITPNGVKTSKLYTIKPNDGTGDLTVSRNTSATRIDENGNIVDVSANVARIDYSTGQPAILVEPQRTNLVYPSDIATTQVRAVTAQVYTLSFYGTGTVTLSGAFSGSLVGTGTNNRVSLTFTPTAGNLTLTVSGSVTNWQLEAGSNATSLIKTITGSVTRNADNISKSGIYTNGLITSNGGTMFIELKNNIPVIGSNFSDFNLGIGSTSNGYGGNGSLSLWNFTSVISRLQILKNVGGTYSILYTSTTDNCKIVIKWNGTTVDVFENGVKVVNASSFNITNMNFLYGNGQRRSFLLNKMFLFTTPLTDTQAIQLTTL